MKVKLLIAAGALAGVTLVGFNAPGANAACSTGPTRTTDAEGNPDGTDTQATAPGTGSEVYRSGAADNSSGVVGISGDTGYLEAGGETADPSAGYVQGSSDAVEGRITSGGVCINDTSAP